MVARPFTELLKRRAREFPKGQSRSERAKLWFRSAARSLSVTPGQMIASPDLKKVNRMSPDLVGALVLFLYDPKLKAELPYYDRFPCSFIVDIRDGDFLGINMHYLPPFGRAQLMDAMMPLRTDNNYDDKTRLKLSYETLKAASRFQLFRPCLKSYLPNHVRSPYMVVKAEDWDKALFLPLARFQKASQEQVWRESVGARAYNHQRRERRRTR